MTILEFMNMDKYDENIFDVIHSYGVDIEWCIYKQKTGKTPEVIVESDFESDGSCLACSFMPLKDVFADDWKLGISITGWDRVRDVECCNDYLDRLSPLIMHINPESIVSITNGDNFGGDLDIVADTSNLNLTFYLGWYPDSDEIEEYPSAVDLKELIINDKTSSIKYDKRKIESSTLTDFLDIGNDDGWFYRELMYGVVI